MRRRQTGGAATEAHFSNTEVLPALPRASRGGRVPGTQCLPDHPAAAHCPDFLESFQGPSSAWHKLG